ncbi:MAG: phosphodiester glycosidase family protein [Bacilli bacterium]|nr:phosphodiester glycosidase family protein [Bacilli bacterium]
MKKLILFLCITILVFTFSFSQVTGRTYDDTSSVYYEPTTTTQKILNGGAEYINAWGVTNRSGTNYSQQVNVLSMKTDQSAKAVTWASPNSTGTGFTRKTVANIAKDYEANHPGWKVMGAINADQYYPKFGTGVTSDGSDYFYPQPYYPMIADYHKWFSITAIPYLSGHVVGFLNDGSSDPLVYKNAGWGYTGLDKVNITGLYVSILDIETSTTSKFRIENFNEAPLSGQSSLYTPVVNSSDTVPSLNVNGKQLFIVEDAELAYASNSTTFTYKSPHNQNAFFGQGTVSKTATQVILNKGQFAIDTTNSELIAALNIGDQVVVQYEYDGILNEVESAIGFHKIMRKDNVDESMIGSGTYNTSLYPRSMFGRKADGTVVFVVVDGRQADDGMNGVNMQEANAILKHYGVVEGYQMDGGGSVTMVIREGNDFVTVNSPSDGSDRSVFSALLFVVKDIDVTTSVDSVSTNEISLNVTINDEEMDTLFVKLNDETKEVIDGKVTFSNLEPNTTYYYEYLYYKNEVLTNSVTREEISTTKRMPALEMVKIADDGDDLIVRISLYDPDNAVIKKVLWLDETFLVVSSNQVIFEDIDNFTYHQLLLEITYDINDLEGRKTMEITDFTIKTDLISFMDHILNNIKEKIKGTYE